MVSVGRNHHYRYHLALHHMEVSGVKRKRNYLRTHIPPGVNNLNQLSNSSWKDRSNQEMMDMYVQRLDAKELPTTRIDTGIVHVKDGIALTEKGKELLAQWQKTTTPNAT